MFFNAKNQDRATMSEYQLAAGQFFRLLPFQILMLEVSAVNVLVDGAVASNMIGQEAMTAIGLFGPLNHFLYALSITLVSGSQILCGRYIGKNRDEELNNIFTVNQLFSVIVSVILALILLIGSRLDLAALFVSGAEEKAALNAYFAGMSFGIPGLVLGQQLFAFLSLENKTMRTMTASIVCAVSNAVFDILFVGIMGMGIFGLGLASSLSLWIFFIVMAVYYLSGKSMMKFSFKGMRPGVVGSIIRLGYPGAVSRFCEMFRCFIVNSLILTYVGAVGMSSFAASNSVMALFWPIPYGMMAVTRMLLSVSIGSEDREGSKIYMHTALTKGMIAVTGIAAVVILCAKPLTGIFFHDLSDPVYGMTVMALRLLPLCLILSQVSLSFTCYYQTMEKKFDSVFQAVFDGIIGVVMFSVMLIPSLGMNGLYLANIFNGVASVVLIVIYSAVGRKHIPRNLEDLMDMPDEFGAAEGEYVEFSVFNKEDVTTVSERVQEFCLSKGVDRRRAMFSGLALEEMVSNVVQHGFAGDKWKHSVDVRVICKNEDVILRVRDDCVAFDPSEQMKVYAPEDGVKNAGLRLLLDDAKEARYFVGIPLAYGISKDMNYNNILGLNVLMIKI